MKIKLFKGLCMDQDSAVLSWFMTCNFPMKVPVRSENWYSGDLVDLGDLLVVLTPDDFKQVSVPGSTRRVPVYTVVVGP